jgi:hypothetical protein
MTAPSSTLNDPFSRAQAYLAKIPGALQGKAGDRETYKVACKLVRDFGLLQNDALKLMIDWNQTCQPPWNEKDLRDKIEHALKYGTKPIGHLQNSNFHKPKAKEEKKHYKPAGGSSPRTPSAETEKQARQKSNANIHLPNTWKERPISAWYDYQNPTGDVVYRVARIEYQDSQGKRKKEFPVLCQGTWGLKGKNVEKIPFHLPELLAAPDDSEIWICEGEKDVLSLEKLGFIATTNLGGAKKWQDNYQKYFKPTHKIVLAPDNDNEGAEHSRLIAELLHGCVESIKILFLPNLPVHGDVSDFTKDKDQEAVAEELSRLSDGAPEYAPILENLSEASSEPKPRFDVLWAKEALKPQPEIKWIIDKLFSTGSVNLIVGEGGSKKTWSVLDMAVCVAKGVKWLNLRTLQSTVLIVDEESGKNRLSRRLGDVMRGHDADESLPLAYVCLSGVTLREGSPDIAYLLKLIKETQSKFVVIDALADVMLGADENSVKEVQPVFAALRKIADETQSALLIIHHSNKDKGGYRGSSAMKGAVDLLLKVESKTDSSQIDFSVEKARDEMIKPFGATAHFSLGRFHLTDADPMEREKHLSNSKEYVLRYLSQHHSASVKEIKSNADTCSAGAARQAIYDLARKGKVQRVDEGGKGEEAVYALKI